MMTSLPTKQVGRTDIHVPVLGLGGAPLAGLYEPVAEGQALQTVHFCLSHGINFFDTAPFYSAGLSERRIGKALADVPRDSYVLST